MFKLPVNLAYPMRTIWLTHLKRTPARSIGVGSWLVFIPTLLAVEVIITDNAANDILTKEILRTSLKRTENV